LRGLANPVGVKVGPSMKDGDLTRLLDVLDSKREPGKVTLITRYGADQISKCLPQHIREVQKSGHVVVWSCDPMHGNTETINGRKTRSFHKILRELRQAFQIHKENDSQLNGVHFELTGDRVTGTFLSSYC
jgi:3-deoxy-7-phosphoheptulonate synthase